MEMVLRTSEALRLASPYMSIGVVLLMVCILAVRVVKGSRVHRACLAWTALPMGACGIYSVVAAAATWYSGHLGHALMFASVAFVHCTGAFFFARLARSL